MGPPLPTVGIGEPVDLAVERLETASARSCSTAATPSACSPAPTCSAFLDRRRDRWRPRDQGLRHPRGPRRPGPTRDRRGRAADLAGHDLRAGGGRQAPRLRVQPQRQPDPTALETCLASLEGGRHGPRLRQRAGGRGRPPPAARAGRPRPHPERRLRRHHPLARPGPRPAGLVVDTVDLTDLDAVGAAWTAGHAHGVGRDADQPLAPDRRHRGGRRLAHERGRPLSWSTTPSPRRASSSRSRSAPTSSSTRPPSTSAATATWSAASCRSTTTARRAARVPAERRRAPCRSVRLLPRAAGLQDARSCAWTATAPTPRRSPSGSSTTRPSPRCSTRAADPPGHDWPPARCRPSAGWCPSGSPGGEQAALEVCRRTELFTLAESLGAVESLIEHPARMTHASVAGTANRVPPTWSACPSASRTPPTSSPTSSCPPGGLGGLRGSRPAHRRGGPRASGQHGHGLRAPPHRRAAPPRCSACALARGRLRGRCLRRGRRGGGAGPRRHGAVPVRGDDDLLSAYERVAASADRFIGFELSPVFHPDGRIWDLDTYWAVLGIASIGAKHSSLERQPEWDGLSLAGPELRPSSTC